MKFHVPFLGSKVRILVVHLHTHVANNATGFNKEQKAISDWLSALILDYKVDILMGDFNMWLWKVVPELRKQGDVIP